MNAPSRSIQPTVHGVEVPLSSGGRFVALFAGLRRRGCAIAAACEQWAHRHPLAASILVVLAFAAAFFAVFTPGYQTNDDVWMAMIVAGKGVSLAPDEHLIYSNVVVGQALRALYIALPSAPWYGCHLYLAQIVAHIALLYSALAQGYTRRGLVLYAAYFVTVGVFFFNNLQFTATAFVVAQSGAILCVAGLVRRVRQPSAAIVGPLICGVLLLVWGALIRTDGYFLVLLCAAAPACVAFRGAAARVVLRPGICALGVSLALVAGFMAYNNAYYRRDPQWRAFYDYNRLRLKFNDYRWTFYDAETAPVFDDAGWTENDHAMIAHWFFDDAARYGEDQLRGVLDAYPWRQHRATTAYYAGAARDIVRDKTVWLIVLILPALVWSVRGNRRAVAAILACVAVSVLLLGALAVMTKPPPSRVYVPVLAFPLVVALVLSGAALAGASSTVANTSQPSTAPPAGNRRLETRRKAMALVPTALAIIAVGMGLSRQFRQSTRTIAARQELTRYVHDLAPREDWLYVTWASSFPFEAISPFDNLASFASFRIVALSWPQTTPLAQEMKRAFEIDDLPRALYERSDVLLIAQEQLLPLYATYVREHYGQTVEVARLEAGGARDAVMVRRRDQDGSRVAAREPRTLPPVSWRVVR